MAEIYSELLEIWCESLLKLQVKETKMNGLHGGIMCPSCSRIHGRASDAIYPFLYMAHIHNNEKYLDAAISLFDWSKHISRPDGSWICETSSDWKGITVFGAIQLGEALKYHGVILDHQTYSSWINRLRSAAEYLYHNIKMSTGNINYPITCSCAMALAGEVLDEPRYTLKAHELAHNALKYFTANGLVFGEGSPQTGITKRGCRPVDLGYNVEETLPGLVQYSLLTRDDEVLQTVIEGLKQHLEFMLPDGAWDNSWGTRSFKWSYWGSRTSDGCQAGYALLKDHDPVFAEAALRNAILLKKCTHEGILYGGPHYQSRGYLPCIHHTLFHAKAFASVLDHKAQTTDDAANRVAIPREKAVGVREYKEINTWLVSKGEWKATVTAYDWEYMKESHASGGAISLLWHDKAGCLIAGSLTEYQMEEENNMQLPIDTRHMCITPRLEFRHAGEYYRSINDIDAVVTFTQNEDEINFFVKGKLVDKDHKNPETGEVGFEMEYVFSPDSLKIFISVLPGNNTRDIFYHLPVISEHLELVKHTSEQCFTVYKDNCQVVVEANTVLAVQGGEEKERIFNLVPGFEAVPLFIRLPSDGNAKLQLKVEMGEN
jgi:hypothetical protein